MVSLPTRTEAANSGGVKPVSCGVLVWSSGRLLLGQPTGRRFWDIPKGLAEPGETWRPLTRAESVAD